MCSGELCLHKTTFQSLGRSNYQCPQCASVSQVRNILFEQQTKHSFSSSAKGFTLLKRVQNQFKMLLEMSIVLANTVPTQRNLKLLAVIKQLRDPFVVVESVELGCLFIKFLLCYKSS